MNDSMKDQELIDKNNAAGLPAYRKLTNNEEKESHEDLKRLKGVDIFGKDHGAKIEAIRNKVLEKRNR
jgi:hypothetical protein